MRTDRTASWARGHPRVVDAVVGAVAVTASVTAGIYSPAAVHDRVTAPEVLIAVAAVAVVTFRRRAPLPVVGVLAVGTVLVLAAGLNSGVTGGALLVAIWSLAVHRPRTVSVPVGGAVALVLLVRALVAEGAVGLRADNLNLVILTVLATVLGVAGRDRRAFLAGVVDRAERAEQSREHEAARRVAEERVRIARDLHDSLAHHMAVVTVQTGVAQHLLTTRPDAAADALDAARAAAGQVLDELGEVLGVLRSVDDGGPTEPAPTLAGIERLLAPQRRAGMDLSSTITGRPRSVGPAVDQAAYRLVQEALTNAGKHAGGGRVRLTVDYRADAVLLELVNTAGRPSGASASGGGFGLLGMRERCAAAGATLDAGATADGGFRVAARFPATAPGPVPDSGFDGGDR